MTNIYIILALFIIIVSILEGILSISALIIGIKRSNAFVNKHLAMRHGRINTLAIIAIVYLLIWFSFFVVFFCAITGINSVADYDMFRGLWLFNHSYLIPREVLGINTGNTLFAILFFGILGAKGSSFLLILYERLKKRTLHVGPGGFMYLRDN